MTKIGEGATPEQPTEVTYQKQLQENIANFNTAWAHTQSASSQEEKDYYQSAMNTQMGLINSNIREIRRSGIQKQGETVKGDYERYMKDPSEKNLTTLQQTMSTLKEYSELPEPPVKTS